jgi:hypothetical protein
MLKQRKILILVITIVCGVFILSGCSEQENSSAPTLQMKSEYVKLLDDDILVEMITDSYSFISQGVNEKGPENNYINISESIATYNEFIGAAVEEFKDSDDKKYEVYKDVHESISEILNVSTSGDLLLDKDSDEKYQISKKRKISDDDLIAIKKELNEQLDKYFE